jgi:predicted dehydrogenase
MAQEICRWGILGTAFIAKKNWKSIWNCDNATLVAVASRSEERAAEYIAENQAQVPFDPAPEAVGSYEALLARDDIDAVYIPLPTGVRKEWVVRAAEAGKHVMGEKPCGDTLADVEEIVAACEANNVQYMDGVMFMHSDRLPTIRKTIDSGEIGDLRRIATQFSFFAPDDFKEGNIRVSSSLESLGCLGDLGWYNIRFTLFVMQYALPERVTGRLLTEFGRGDSPNPVPVEFSGEIFWPNGVSSSFYCSFVTEHQQWAHVSGTKGYLRLDDFVLPYFGSDAGFDVANHTFDFYGSDFNMRNGTRHVPVPEYSNSFPGAQETELFRNFSDLVISGTPDPFWPEVSLKTQQILNACLESARNDSQPVEL